MTYVAILLSVLELQSAICGRNWSLEVTLWLDLSKSMRNQGSNPDSLLVPLFAEKPRLLVIVI